jgi:UDP-N-acetylglucosamine 2-epimerase (non-hydrolysing)/UDP-GlcNAc3NAcA epimerase
MRILTVVGNRPQFIKAAAVSRHVRERGDEILVHTGQHYDRELSDLFFEELGVPAPDHLLGVGAGSHGEQTARTMIGLEPLVASSAPDAVLVYGDTNATLGGALVAAKRGVPLAHVEAGMRSFALTMPEEVNRVVADRLSGLLLCSTPTAMENLQREGLGEGARLVGDVMADVALTFGPIAEGRSQVLEDLGLERGSYLLATAHRAENVDDPARLGQLVDVLVAASHEAPLVFPLHPRTASRLDASGLRQRLDSSAILSTSPLGYLDITCLLRGARTLLTDSGGLQKEAFLAGVPCVTLRRVTEWTETVEAGWNRLVDLDAQAAITALRDFASGGELPRRDPGLYGSGRAGESVAAEIAAWLESS